MDMKRVRKSKKDAQGLEELLRDDTDENVSKVLHQWKLSYRSLTQDVDRNVRQRTAEMLHLFVTRLKRSFAPFLKGLIGPWWLAQHDTHTPTAEIARATFDVTAAGLVMR